MPVRRNKTGANSIIIKKTMTKLKITILLIAVLLISCEKNAEKELGLKSVLNGWEVSKSNYGFDINARDLFFLNSEIGFVVGYNGEMHKTINAGKSWTKQISGTTLHLFSVFFLNENIGFASGQAMSGCLDQDCGKGSVFLKTTDGGETWTKSFFKDYTGIYSLKFFDASKGLAIIHTPDVPNSRDYYIAKTSDGGNSWTFADLPINPANDRFFCVDNMIFVAGENQKIFKSKDYGNSWQTINTPISVSNNVGHVYFYNENIGFIDGGTNIYKTTDGGLNWEVTGFPFSILDVFHFYNETEGFNVKIVSVYDGGDWPTFKGSINYQTSDGGVSWNKSALIDSLFLGFTYFPQRDLGYGMNGKEFYTMKRK